MRLIRWLVNFLAGTIVAVLSLYFVISIVVLIFRLTGRLSEGERMYLDARTPTYAGLLSFQAICFVVISACFAVRNTIGQKNDFSFLRRNRS
jgi:hypothetical protein